MLDHIPICPDNSQPAGNLFHSRWIKGAVKPRRQFYRPFCRMVGNQHRQSDFWMLRFGIDHSPGCQAIKSAVVPDNELRDAIFHYVLLDGIPQRRQDLGGCFPVSDEKTAFHKLASIFRITKFLLLYLVLPNIARLRWHIITPKGR